MRFSLIALLLVSAEALVMHGGPVAGAQQHQGRRLACLRLLSPVLALAPFVLAPATVAAADSSVFEGRYTDPNNHPGGTREIMVEGTAVGAYKLAKVRGGGGRGEPANYELPAIIVERQGVPAQIIIDFSVAPKNGPRDFAGVYDAKAGGIRFSKDGNVWPKQ